MSPKPSVQPEASSNLCVVYNACTHDCPGCSALETRVDGQGRAVSVRGRSDHPVTRGWLCAKVNRYLDRVYHPGRLLYPMRRIGLKGNGSFERISWEDAIAEITEHWRDIIARHGAQCILPYRYAGTLGLVNHSVTNTRFLNRLRACRLERAICGDAAEQATMLSIAARLSPPPEMLVHRTLIFSWASD